MAQNQGAGPIPLAAHTQHPGLHMLLGVVAVSQHAVADGDVDTLAAQARQLRAAREALELRASRSSRGGFQSHLGWTPGRSPDPLVLVVCVPSGVPLVAVEQVVHLVPGEFRLVHGPS
jgi:uncharacterized protein DUF6245